MVFGILRPDGFQLCRFNNGWYFILFHFTLMYYFGISENGGTPHYSATDPGRAKGTRGHDCLGNKNEEAFREGLLHVDLVCTAPEREVEIDPISAVSVRRK